MINPKNISETVRETLRYMDVHEPSVVNLIKGTFATESQFEELHDFEQYTMANLTEKEVKNLYDEIIRYSKKIKDKVKKATDIDCDNLSLNKFKFHLNSNIEFMTAVLYVFYSTKYDDIPENDIDSIAKSYVKYFVGEVDYDAEVFFKETYLKFFV